jgi:hypothetical protein
MAAYARVAPGSWLIERDNCRGSQENESVKVDDDVRDAQNLMIAKIIREAKSGDMARSRSLYSLYKLFLFFLGVYRGDVSLFQRERGEIMKAETNC